MIVTRVAKSDLPLPGVGDVNACIGEVPSVGRLTALMKADIAAALSTSAGKGKSRIKCFNVSMAFFASSSVGASGISRVSPDGW